jgi:hypothetical protein
MHSSRIWLFVAAVISLTACKRQAEFVAPKEAEFAVAAAKGYAETKGWKHPTLRDAKVRDGVWTIEMLSESSRDSLDYASVQASSEGKVILYGAPR